MTAAAETAAAAAAAKLRRATEEAHLLKQQLEASNQVTPNPKP